LATVANPTVPYVAPAELRFVLRGVRWQTYESLLSDHAGRSVPRFTYDRGTLEMMTPLDRHEDARRCIRKMIEIWSRVKRIPIRGKGSRTYRQEEMARGFEADECYYILNHERIRGKRELDLTVDPSPDLALEIDITASSLNKLAVYAALRVLELWIYDGETLTIHVLGRDGAYEERSDSLNLPGFPAGDIAVWLERYYELDEFEWEDAFAAWVAGMSA
jgi:Uma2 family endonuclease